jgi:hypothetical protein
VAGLELKPESSSRLRTTPTGGPRARRERRELARGGLVKEVGPAGPHEEGRKKRKGQLGWTVR